MPAYDPPWSIGLMDYDTRKVRGGNGRMIIEHLPDNAEFVPELVCEGLWNMGRDRNDLM